MTTFPTLSDAEKIAAMRTRAKTEAEQYGQTTVPAMLLQGAAWGAVVAAPERYGRRRVSKMLAEWNALRAAVAAGDPEATQDAFDACEEWIDFAYGRAALEGPK